MCRISEDMYSAVGRVDDVVQLVQGSVESAVRAQVGLTRCWRLVVPCRPPQFGQGFPFGIGRDERPRIDGRAARAVQAWADSTAIRREQSSFSPRLLPR